MKKLRDVSSNLFTMFKKMLQSSCSQEHQDSIIMVEGSAYNCKKIKYEKGKTHKTALTLS